LVVAILVFLAAAPGVCGAQEEAAAGEKAKGKAGARGELVFSMGDTERNSMAHWDEYAWKFEALRPGNYRVAVR
jgi:hypothetical protein